MGDPTGKEKKYICITVANRGRRTVTLSAVALKMRDGIEAAVSGSLQQAVELTEGKSRSFFMEQADLERKYALADVRHAFAVDQTGKVWKGKFHRPRGK